jgi:hypothetical protein
MTARSTPRSRNDRKPRAILSDYFYLVLAGLGLLQVPTTIQASGVWIGILYGAAILCFTYLIAAGNKGRLTPWIERESRS